MAFKTADAFVAVDSNLVVCFQKNPTGMLVWRYHVAGTTVDKWDELISMKSSPISSTYYQCAWVSCSANSCRPGQLLFGCSASTNKIVVWFTKAWRLPSFIIDIVLQRPQRGATEPREEEEEECGQRQRDMLSDHRLCVCVWVRVLGERISVVPETEEDDAHSSDDRLGLHLLAEARKTQKYSQNMRCEKSINK